MKNKVLILMLLISYSIVAPAQSQKVIVQKEIEMKKFWEQSLEDGDKTPYLEKEEKYNTKGELIEVKEFSEKGKKIKLWIKYKYDDNGELIEEKTLGSKGEQTERFVYKYDKDLRIEKTTYDSKDRIIKRKTYEYQYRK